MRSSPESTPLLPLGLLLAVALGAMVAVALDERVTGLAVNTLLLAGGTAALALPIGTFLALATRRSDLPGRDFLGGVLLVLLFVPLYLLAAAWQAGFGPQGWFQLHFGGEGVAPLLTGWRGAIIVHGFAAIPWVATIVGAALTMAEPELEEDALLAGDSAQVLAAVTLRRALPGVGIAALWILVMIAGEMTVTDLYQVRTYAEEIYTGFAQDTLAEVQFAMLPSVAFLAAIVAATAIACWQLSPLVRESYLRPAAPLPLGAFRWPAAIGAWTIVLLLVTVPLANLAYKAGIQVEQVGDARERIWSPLKCLSMVAASPWRYRVEFGWSLAIGVATATVSLLLAAPAAWLARGGGVASWIVLALCAIALALPGPQIGLWIIGLLNRPDADWVAWLYDRTIVPPCLAQLTRAWPWATLLLWHAWQTLPQPPLENATLDGAGGWSRFWRVALPQRWQMAACAWLVALAISLGDLSASVLVLPPGIMPVSWQVFQLLHAGVEDDVAGLCLAWALVLAAVGIAVARIGSAAYNGRELESRL